MYELVTAIAQTVKPTLTWYSDSERIELSGAVLSRWVSKTANFLSADLGAQAGTVVLVDLPVHWRGTVWSLAAWCTGASVSFDATHDADVVVTNQPIRWSDSSADVLALALPSLAASFEGPTAAMTIDANAEVMNAADALGEMESPTQSNLLLLGATYRYDDWADFINEGSRGRILFQPSGNAEFARVTCSQVARGGSVVAIDALASNMDPTHIAEQERAEVVGRRLA